MANAQPPVVIIIDDDDDAPIPQAPPPPPRAPPRRGISYIDALNQTAYVAERPPRSVLYTEGELTHDEHTCFIGLSQQMHEFKEGRHVPYELRHWKGFWDTVFENWDTTVGNADDRPLRLVTLSDNRIRAGRLKMNHPPSAEYPGPPGPNRLQNCPVYMSVSPSAQDQLLQAIWKDKGGGGGGFVSPAYVEMEIELGDALDLAVLRFDRPSTSRIKDYDITCITNAARCRLMHFAAVGRQMAAYIPADCRAPILEVPELVGDRAEGTARA